jgi:dihydroflavonol-4-reductase
LRALVTGAAGFIGSHVVVALARAGIEVRAFDRIEPARPPAGVELVRGDLLDRRALREALEGCDAVLHLAALYSYSPRDADAMVRVNVEGTRLLLEEAGTRRIIHLRAGRRSCGDRGRCAACVGVADPLQTNQDRC